jgi:hypothetical protein
MVVYGVVRLKQNVAHEKANPVAKQARKATDLFLRSCKMAGLPKDDNPHGEPGLSVVWQQSRGKPGCCNHATAGLHTAARRRRPERCA